AWTGALTQSRKSVRASLKGFSFAFCSQGGWAKKGLQLYGGVSGAPQRPDQQQGQWMHCAHHRKDGYITKRANCMADKFCGDQPTQPAPGGNKAESSPQFLLTEQIECGRGKADEPSH